MTFGISYCINRSCLSGQILHTLYKWFSICLTKWQKLTHRGACETVILTVVVNFQNWKRNLVINLKATQIQEMICRAFKQFAICV